MFGSTFTGEDNQSEDLISWGERTMTTTTTPPRVSEQAEEPALTEAEFLALARCAGFDVVINVINPPRTVGTMTRDVLKFGELVASAINQQVAPAAPTLTAELVRKVLIRHLGWLGAMGWDDDIKAICADLGASPVAAPEAPASAPAWPALPDAICRDDTLHGVDYHTADQMHQHGKSCVEADRRFRAQGGNTNANRGQNLASPAATTASASGERYECTHCAWSGSTELVIGDGTSPICPECDGPARAQAPSREAAPQIKTWQERFTRFGGPSKDVAIEAEIAELRAALTEWERLRDPATLHANLLRGVPARLAARELLHIAGGEAAPQIKSWKDRMGKGAPIEHAKFAMLEEIDELRAALAQQGDATGSQP